MAVTLGGSKRIDIILKRNSVFTLGFYLKDPETLEPVDLADWTARIFFREQLDGKILIEFTLDDNMSIDEADGYVQLKIQPEEIQTWEFGGGVWDIQLVDPLGDESSPVWGKVTVEGAVTY